MPPSPTPTAGRPDEHPREGPAWPGAGHAGVSAFAPAGLPRHGDATPGAGPSGRGGHNAYRSSCQPPSSGPRGATPRDAGPGSLPAPRPRARPGHPRAAQGVAASGRNRYAAYHDGALQPSGNAPDLKAEDETFQPSSGVASEREEQPLNIADMSVTEDVSHPERGETSEREEQ